MHFQEIQTPLYVCKKYSISRLRNKGFKYPNLVDLSKSENSENLPDFVLKAYIE